MQTKEEAGYIFALCIVTCKTEGCLNFNIPLELWVDVDGGLAECGPCNAEFDLSPHAEAFSEALNNT